MKRLLYILLCCLGLFALSGKCAMDYDYPLYLDNQSNRRIQFWTPNTGEVGYPDTALHQKPRGVIIYPKKKLDVAGGGVSWEKIYEEESKDTLSFFLFDVDTLERYTWDFIKENYQGQRI